MTKRVDSGPKSSEETSTERSVVDLADARVRLKSRARGGVSDESLARELEDVRSLLDQGLTIEARSRLTSLIAASRHNPSILALSRCALSISLEMQNNHRESLAAIAMYETPESRAKLGEEANNSLRVQLSIAYNYNGDHPRAISLLKSALRELTESGEESRLGPVYAALARVYRSINEYPISRDYSQRALEHFRGSGDWRGLVEAYFGIAAADSFEGAYESSLENYELALKLIGERPASFMLGRIYANMAGACWFLKRPQEGIRYLEKAISYYERTDQKGNAANGYNNLGINLILIGQSDRAHEALDRALTLGSEVDERGPQVPMILDSLGDLQMLRGNLEESRSYLERSVSLAKENGNKWYACQALRTLGRCMLAMGDESAALVNGAEALTLAEAIGDRQAICESRLILAEAHLSLGDLAECSAELQRVTEQASDSPTDLNFSGEAQRVYGKLAMVEGDPGAAAQHFGRSVSIFDMLGDRYRAARVHYELGRACAATRSDRATEHLTRAANTFRELGARIDLAQVEEALGRLDRTTPDEQQPEPPALTQLLTLRLAEAVASRELLLRELAAIMKQETKASRIVIAERGDDNRARVVITHGCTPHEAATIAEGLDQLKTEAERERYAKKHDASLIALRSSNAAPAILYMGPRNRASLPASISLEPLLRIVELGMDVCALRAGAHKSSSAPEQDTLAGASLMPGFIHSSPAMTRLVEEVHKIRSSDVTVLVTGESGTGKELVARAIHAISSRRSKVFLP